MHYFFLIIHAEYVIPDINIYRLLTYYSLANSISFNPIYAVVDIAELTFLREGIVFLHMEETEKTCRVQSFFLCKSGKK